MKSRTCFYCSYSSSSVAKTDANVLHVYAYTCAFTSLFNSDGSMCTHGSIYLSHKEVSNVKLISSYETQLLGKMREKKKKMVSCGKLSGLDFVNNTYKYLPTLNMQSFSGVLRYEQQLRY